MAKTKASRRGRQRRTLWKPRPLLFTRLCAPFQASAQQDLQQQQQQQQRAKAGGGSSALLPPSGGGERGGGAGAATLAAAEELKRRRARLLPPYEMTGYTGSLRYMAPEVATNRPYDESVDVYSLVLVLWEIASLER